MYDIQTLRKENFVLWRPGKIDPLPEVFITKVIFNYKTETLEVKKVGCFPLIQSNFSPDVWIKKAVDCNLEEGNVYHYWFKVANCNPYENNNNIIYCTDPFALAVDERIQACNLPVNETYQNHYSPGTILKYINGKLEASDPDGNIPNWENFFTKDKIQNLKPNNQLVIYEVPPRWSSMNNNTVCIGGGNFRQVEKMIDFSEDTTYLDSIFKKYNTMLYYDKNGNKSILSDCKYIEYLGVNALELTPPANSSQQYNWGYGTAEFLAPDFSLSVRNNESKELRPATDFINLVKTCHKKGIRFFYDAVMAFASNNPYRNINYMDFFIHWTNEKKDPEQGDRDGFGGDLIKYKYEVVHTYNPNNGKIENIYPSREYMMVHLNEWIKNKGVSGLRLDSVVNIDCFDFLRQIKNQTRDIFNKNNGLHDDKFLVVAEELSVPASLLNQNVVDGQWNEVFKQILRHIILGKNWWGDSSFEWSVKKMIDCRLLDRGFTNGSQAINYITSHDVGGYENYRLFSFLENNGVYDTKSRIKLAFVCLLTAIGIPMILAGEEFGDEQDLKDEHTKQRDPINYQRLAQSEWRQEIFTHVRRLINLRTTSKALWYDNINFIHSDFNEGKRVLSWVRGQDTEIVVTVANFSDWGSPLHCGYKVNNMPIIPNGFKWVEVTQSRFVNDIDDEMLMPWEAKVYLMQKEGIELYY